MQAIALLLAVVFFVFTGGHADKVIAAETKKDSQVITRSGSQPSAKGTEKTFTGNVRRDPLFGQKETAPFSGTYVTFEPGARTFWHKHPAGQHLIVTFGVGRLGEWGGKVKEIRAGDVIWCPPGVKHWHGASPTAAMTHIAISGIRDGKTAEWLEEVTDAQYGKTGEILSSSEVR